MIDDEVSKTSEALIDVQKVEVQETKIETIVKDVSDVTIF